MMLKNWIKIAFRSYRKNLLFTIINILGLSVGLVGIILVTLYWNDELSFNQWNPNKDTVYAVSHQFNWSVDISYMAISPVPEGPTIKEMFPEVEDFMACNNWLKDALVKTDKNAIYLEDILYATSNFFEFFPFEFVQGTSQNVIADLQSIAISEDWATQLFGNEQSIGEKLQIEDKEYIVKGVYKIPGPSSVVPKAVVNLDWSSYLEKNGSNWRTFMVSKFLKISRTANINQLSQKINEDLILKNVVLPFAEKQNMTPEEYIEKNGSYNLMLDKLSELRLFSKSGGGGGGIRGNIRMLYILTGLSVIILILSAFNYINLTTASSIKRAKEVGIRKALGSPRTKLILQFVFESFILCVLSLILALALSEVMLPYFNTYFDKALTIRGQGIYLYLVLILLFITLVAGLIPALYLSNFRPLIVLKGNFIRSTKGIWVRNIILGLQFIISLFFLISGMIIYLQVRYMVTKDLGFKGEQVVSVSFANEETIQKLDLIKQEFQKIDGVTEVGSGLMIPGASAYVGGKAKSEKTGEEVSLALSGAMDYNFPDILDLTIIEGRNISEEYASDTISSALINETLAQQLNLQQPIGEEIFYNPAEKNFKIIGVVKDYFVNGFEKKIDPVLYFHWNAVSWTKNQMNYVLFKIEPDKMPSALAAIESKWQSEIEPGGYPFNYKFVDQQFAKSYKEHQRQQKFFSVLIVLAIGIALLGLFGLVSFVIEQRMKELSIRKILGATQVNIIRLIGKEYIIIGLVSTLISIPITYYAMQKWLEDFVYRIDMPFVPYLLGVIILMALALLIVTIRASYAMKISPVKYLKYE